MPKTAFLAVLLVTVALLAVEAYLAFNPAFLQVKRTETQQLGNQSTVSPSLPLIDLNHPALRYSNLSYGLKGKILKIKDHPEGVELITDIMNNPTIPPFIITKVVGIFFGEKQAKKQATIADLQVGQVVEISISYDLLFKTWTVWEVDILQPSKPSTSSALSQ